MTDGLIAVLPRNYRRIALYAIQVAADPVVLMDGARVTDFSERGPLYRTRLSRVSPPGAVRGWWGECRGES